MEAVWAESKDDAFRSTAVVLTILHKRILSVVA